MLGLDPSIHDFYAATWRKTWILGSSPRMTVLEADRAPVPICSSGSMLGSVQVGVGRRVVERPAGDQLRAPPRGDEDVAHDRVRPADERAARLVEMHLLDRAFERFLDQIVGRGAIALERAREPPQVGNVMDEQILER